VVPASTMYLRFVVRGISGEAVPADGNRRAGADDKRGISAKFVTRPIATRALVSARGSAGSGMGTLSNASKGSDPPIGQAMLARRTSKVRIFHERG